MVLVVLATVATKCCCGGGGGGVESSGCGERGDVSGGDGSSCSRDAYIPNSSSCGVDGDDLGDGDDFGDDFSDFPSTPSPPVPSAPSGTPLPFAPPSVDG